MDIGGILVVLEAIKAEELVKYYGDTLALNNVSFSVDKGEIFGFLGPNGAGKTTTVKILTTLIRPNKGSAYVLGFDVLSEGNEVRKRIGMVQQQLSFDHFLSVEKNIEMYGILRGVPKRDRKRKVKELLDEFGLVDVRKKHPLELSIGQRRRIQVAREFIHNPEVLFLDEPTIGLDPYARRKTLELIKDKVMGGLTVFFTTHLLEEAEYLCDRVAVIKRGRIVLLDRVKELKEQFSKRGELVEVIINGADKAYYNNLQKLPSVIAVFTPKDLGDEPVGLCVRNAEDVLSEILDLVTRDGKRLKIFNIKEITLEDIFIQITTRSNSNGV